MSKRRVPSPATMLSLLALVVALSGSAYAALKVTGKDVENKSLTGKDVKKDSLGGKQIAEAMLGTVPSATTAGSADNAGSAVVAESAASADRLMGFDFAAIDATHARDNPGTPQTVLDLGGLQLRLGCTSSSYGPTLTAATTTDDASIRTSLAREDEQLTLNDADFDAGEQFSVTDGFGLTGMVHVLYRRSSGSGHQVVSATLSVDSGFATCHAYGHAVAEAP